nr:nuclear transport factor 2 family protein [Pedobacter sp. SYSU D00823]
MQAQRNNDVPQLRKLLDKDVRILTPGKLGEIEISKGEYLSFLQQVGKLDQDCYPQYEIVKLTPNTAEVNIDFAYPDFVAKHSLTMVKKGDDWKIIQLRKLIETEPAPVTVMQQ